MNGHLSFKGVTGNDLYLQCQGRKTSQRLFMSCQLHGADSSTVINLEIGKLKDKPLGYVRERSGRVMTERIG